MSDHPFTQRNRRYPNDFLLQAYFASKYKYDAEGRLTGGGDHEANALAEYWRKSLPSTHAVNPTHPH